MDEGQNFCLQWNSYQTSVTSLFNDLRRDGELVDVTLCAQGQQIKVHRMMLSACSPYFRDVLKGNLGTHPVFFMRDISFKDLSNIVEFMYRGKVNVAQSELGSFLKTAETLQVRGLTGDDEPAQPEPPKKTKTSTPSAPPPPRLSPEPPRHRAAPQPPPPPPPPPLAAAPPSKRPLSPPPTSSGEHALLTPKRPRSVDQPAPAAAPEAALPRPGSEPLSVKEEPLVLEDGDDSYHGGGGENSSGSGGVMPLLGDSDAPHMGFLTGTPTHPQAHEFQDEDLLAAVAGPSGFPSQDLSDSSTPGGRSEVPPGPARATDRHHQEVTATGALLYRCPVCHKAVSWTARSHHKAVHSGRTVCPRCGRQLASLKSFNKHRENCRASGDTLAWEQAPPPAPPVSEYPAEWRGAAGLGEERH
ncbi:protein bric-a-brac 1-like isoform X3 [Amphibalanus amphitrite]|uniref:protein bric-a-brac 1-like isoform X4 n=1 Tax=Amphibalanus amphitrite TaxID=1232801 RepID=UPI001C8FFCDE|nr:protein bric-a-brac 1-like isoform X4 [Amphibalanus amphitrite]XP_043198748.1 protein bric-a-brac 1-like isoform X3 [Amphibalanus amphitrite]